MGILLMGMALAYIAVNAVIIALIGWVASRFTDKPRRWVIGATIVSFLILFWDYMPTYLLFRYYCSYQCGLSIHKTLSSWKDEYPGEFKNIRRFRDIRFSEIDGGTRYWLNNRFVYDRVMVRKPLSIYEKRSIVRDIVSGEVMAEYINYSSRRLLKDVRSFDDLKLWLDFGTCRSGKKCDTEGRRFSILREEYKGVGNE